MKKTDLPNKLLSDNYRFLKIFILFVFLLGFGFYGFVFGPKTEISFPECLANPEKYENQELVIYGRVKKITDSDPQIFQRNSDVPVKGIKEPLVVNQTVSGIGNFKKEGFVELKDYHIHRGRQGKILISLLPIPVFLFFFFRDCRFNFRKIVFLKK